MGSKKVMVFGTFDGIHEGHRHFFQQARTFGEHLIVVVSRDAAIAHVYGRPPENDEIDRIAAVLHEKIAQDVVMGHLQDKAKVIAQHKPDIIVLGFTQESLVAELNKVATTLGFSHIDIEIAQPHNSEIYPPSGFDNATVHVD